MYCGRCGGYAVEQSLFCPRCGAPLASGVAPHPPGGSTTPGMWQPPPAVAWPDAPPERGRRTVLIVAGAVVALVLAATGTGVAVLSFGSNHKHPGAGPGALSSTSSAPVPAPATTVITTASPSPTVTFADLYAKEQSGVVRIETLSCSDSGVGTGFLLSPTLVATVEHVIDQSVVVSLIDGTQRTTGTVIGSDPVHDLALVRAATPITGYQFQFASTAPAIGDPVAAIGFPIGDPITFTQGSVSGLDRNINVQGAPRTGMLETDAAVNPGNSGGPLLDSAGTVDGLVDAKDTTASGIAYAVPSEQASSVMQRWSQDPAPQPPADCPNPLGPTQDTPNVTSPPAGSVTANEAAGIVAALNTYFDGIDSGDYAAAYDVLSPSLHSPNGEQAFAAGDASSFDTGITILNAAQLTPDTVRVDVAFTSLQASAQGPNGDTCDNWTLDYTFIQAADGSWQINGNAPINGVDHTTC